MQAAIRLIRASRVFGTIFLSYFWSLTWARLFPKKYDTKERWKRIHDKNAKRMYRGFVKLRGVYIKLGQILSVMGTFLPRSYGVELEGLQDEVPAQPYGTIATTFHKAFGKDPKDVFATFAETPVAAASLGQVHEATDASGKKLAVKILYPNVEMIIRVDLRVLGFALRIYKAFVPVQQIERVHEQLEDMLGRETNLEHESRMIEKMSKNFVDDPDVLFPDVVHEWTHRTVLTMTFMDGVKISKKNALADLGLDPYAVATKLTQVFYKQLFADRFFHADPHPGNIIMMGTAEEPVIGLIDLGLVGRLTEDTRDKAISLMLAAVTSDSEGLADALLAMGKPGGRVDMRAFRAEVEVLSEKYLGRSLAEVEMSALIRDLVQGAIKYDIEMPAELMMVGKALMTVEGIGKQLDPDLDIWGELRPELTRVVMERYSPERIGRDLLRGARKLSMSATSLPGQVHDILDDLRAGRLAIDTRDPALALATERLGRRLFTAIVTATLIGSSTAMLIADVHPTWATILFVLATLTAAWHLFLDRRRGKKKA